MGWSVPHHPHGLSAHLHEDGGDLWDTINSFVQEAPDCSYLVGLDEWLDIFVVTCLKEDLIGGRNKLYLTNLRFLKNLKMCACAIVSNIE